MNNKNNRWKNRSLNLEKAKGLLNLFNFLLVCSILLICTIEWIYKYIGTGLFIRFIIIAVIFLFIRYLIIKVKALNNIIIQLIFTALIGLAVYFDCTFFYQIEFVTIVVPHNYSGKISIKLNDPKS